MKQRLLLLIALLPGLLAAQKEVRFPDDFNPALDGVHVTIKNTLYITDTKRLSSKGTLTLATERIRYATEEAEPSKAMYATWKESLSKRQLLINNFSSTANCRTGQQMADLTGIVRFSNGTYSISTTTSPAVTGHERSANPPEVNAPYNLKIASFNLNFYIADPALWNDRYGAANQAQFTRQRTKILAALQAIDADIYALCEVGEGQKAVQDLVNGLNEATGTSNYAYVDNGDTKGSTYTKNVFVYNSTKVTPYKEFSTLGSYLKLRHVAQAFNLKANGERLILCVNHFKAKSSSSSGTDLQDGQGMFNDQRISEAETIVRELNTLTTRYEDPDVLIVGDLNSYSKEDPIDLLTNASMTNLLQQFAPQEYSYVYDGATGYLDHSIATESMSKQVVDAHPWHINADEQDKFFYKNSSNYAPDPYRSSDHDPIITYVMLNHQTGINAPSSTASIQMFGDPRDGYLTLKGERIDKVEVLSISGQVLFSRTNPTAGSYFTLPVEGLVGGFYLVRTYNGRQTTTHKIVLP